MHPSFPPSQLSMARRSTSLTSVDRGLNRKKKKKKKTKKKKKNSAAAAPPNKPLSDGLHWAGRGGGSATRAERRGEERR